MKTIFFLLSPFMAGTAWAGAKLLGPLVFTIPPLPPPAPDLPAVPASEIVATKVHESGGRKVIVQEVTAAVLPALPDPPPPAPEKPRPPISAETKARIAEARAKQRELDRLTPEMTATVFHGQSLKGQIRTLFRLMVPRTAGELPFTGEAVQFWSSIDANYLSQLPAYQGSDGTIYQGLRLSVSNVDLDQVAAAQADRKLPGRLPSFPEIQNGTFVLTDGTPSPEDLAAIQAVHDIYFAEFEKLKAAFEARQAALKERQAYIKANPEKPKDVTFQFRILDENKRK